MKPLSEKRENKKLSQLNDLLKPLCINYISLEIHMMSDNIGPDPNERPSHKPAINLS